MTRALRAPEPRTAGDRCPGSLRLHEAQDGLLARVRVPGGRLSAVQLGALARAAARGNGLVEVTSRANVQVRGLSRDAAAGLELLLGGAGLLPSAAHDRARNVLAPATAGRHPRALAATDAVVAAIDRRLCADPALAQLPGRFLFAVDDGSGLVLGQAADVTLAARDAATFELALAGQAVAGAFGADEAAALAVAAAAAFLAERGARGGHAWRIAELEGGPAAVAARLHLELSGAFARPAAAALAPGRLVQRDGRVAITALVPLGRLDMVALTGLAEIVAQLRLAAERTVTVVDVEPADADALERALQDLGLIVSADSGWSGLSACAGLGCCPHARIDVRAAAAARAGVRRRGTRAEHWAACERRCGERPGHPVAVAACADGVAIRAGDEERVVVGVTAALEVLA